MNRINFKFNASKLPAHITVTGFESKYKNYAELLEEQEDKKSNINTRSIVTTIGFIILIIGTVFLCTTAENLGVKHFFSQNTLQQIHDNSIIVCTIGIIIMGCGFLFKVKSTEKLTEIQFLEKHYTLIPEQTEQSLSKKTHITVLKYHGDNHFTVTIK